MSVVEEYCFGCSKKRPCKVIDTYKYQGEAYNIYVCQWCRAETTKRNKRSSYLNEDGESIRSELPGMWDESDLIGGEADTYNDFRNNFCYQCGEKVFYLFQDGRCKSCTRMLPEEVMGESS